MSAITTAHSINITHKGLTMGSPSPFASVAGAKSPADLLFRSLRAVYCASPAPPPAKRTYQLTLTLTPHSERYDEALTAPRKRSLAVQSHYVNDEPIKRAKVKKESIENKNRVHMVDLAKYAQLIATVTAHRYLPSSTSTNSSKKSSASIKSMVASLGKFNAKLAGKMEELQLATARALANRLEYSASKFTNFKPATVSGFELITFDPFIKPAFNVAGNLSSSPPVQDSTLPPQSPPSKAAQKLLVLSFVALTANLAYTQGFKLPRMQPNMARFRQVVNSRWHARQTQKLVQAQRLSRPIQRHYHREREKMDTARHYNESETYVRSSISRPSLTSSPFSSSPPFLHYNSPRGTKSRLHKQLQAIPEEEGL